MSIKSGIQVEILLISHQGERQLVAIFKRSQKKGGFWQPITGGHHLDETLVEACSREVLEEVGLNVAKERFKGPIHEFEFSDNGQDHKEYVFFCHLSLDEVDNIVLSDEHTDWKLCTFDEACAYFKWDNNVMAVKSLESGSYLTSDHSF